MDITEAFIKALHGELNEARRNPDINNKVAPRDDYGRKEYFKSMIKDKEISKRDLVGNANQTSNNQPYGKNFDVIRYEKSPNEISNKYRAKINIMNGPYRQEYKDQAISEIETDINNYKQKHKQEARSHKEDNEKAAPRDEFNKAPRYIKNSPYNEIDVPKRAIIHKSKKPNEDGVVWGVVNKDEIDTYEQSTSDIERYKEYKADAERERDNAKYYNALAKQSDDRASDIVRDKKLARAKNTLQGKQLFKTEDLNKINKDENNNEVNENEAKSTPIFNSASFVIKPDSDDRYWLSILTQSGGGAKSYGFVTKEELVGIRNLIDTILK